MRFLGKDMSEILFAGHKNFSVLLCFLIATFAISSWIAINGIFVELPLMVSILPEGWFLPSYLVIVIQIANFAPLLFVLINRKFQRVTEVPVIYAILCLGIGCCLILSLTWSKTTWLYLNGQWIEHSVTLMVLVMFLAIVDCTSSVTFLPMMAAYPGLYLTALYVGEGCSGLLPSLISVIQGIGGDPVCVNVTEVINNTNVTKEVQKMPEALFSVSVYFVILSACCACSLIAFILIRNMKRFMKFLAPQYSSMRSEDELAVSEGTSLYLNSSTVSCDEPENATQVRIGLILVVLINILSNGFMPSISPFTSIPYGYQTYHWVANLGVINPFAALLTLKLRPRKLLTWFTLFGLGVICAIFLIYLASQSPDRVFTSPVGLAETLVILSWACFIAVFSLLKTSIALFLQHRGKRWLMICGISTQIGSLIGAILSFIILNILNVFHKKPSCG